ncbi:MAG: hypothetical protein WDO13_21070 [Verrucomicrobiota bacterium]
MTKDRIIAASIVSLLLLALFVGGGATDAVYVIVSIALFLLAIAYAAWCEKI